MPQVRFAASAGRRRGELQLSDAGMTFTPLASADGTQLGFAIDGWQLVWEEIAGIERVAGTSGDVRVHYDDCLHYAPVRIHEPLRRFFAIVDVFLAERSVHAA